MSLNSRFLGTTTDPPVVGETTTLPPVVAKTTAPPVVTTGRDRWCPWSRPRRRILKPKSQTPLQRRRPLYRWRGRRRHSHRKSRRRPRHRSRPRVAETPICLPVCPPPPRTDFCLTSRPAPGLDCLICGDDDTPTGGRDDDRATSRHGCSRPRFTC